MSPTPNQVLLDKYRIESLLGSGGCGDVYLAQDLELGRQVAIKHLKADWAGDETVLQRFLREARVIAALKHPHIVIIHALEHDGDEHYIVEEYAERGTVGDLLEAQTCLPIEQALDIAIAVCGALEAAHLKGVIHRDIKPSNILLFEGLEGDLVPKLCDFGIAHVPSAEDGRPLTSQGDMLGTVQYMSPEQIQGEKVDERSDLYALGAVLYEMLTGRMVFTGRGWDVLQAHVSQEPTPPVLERSEISAPLNDLVLRALSKDPTDRHQKARGLRKALERIKRREAENRELVASLYAQGVAHLQAEEWQETIELLGNVVTLARDYQDAKELLEKAKQGETLERLYEQGLACARSGAWAEAVEALEKVHRLDENYGDVAALLEKARGQQELETLYSKGISAAQARDWTTAVEKFLQVQEADENYRDVVALLADAREQQSLAELYLHGISCLEQKEWLDAIRCFREIIAEDVTYLDAADRLEYARRQEELESLYSQGTGYARRGKWQQAIDKFEAVLQLDRDYEDAAAHLEEARKQKRAETTYGRGMRHFNRGEWSQAIEQFQGVLDAIPDYKDATDMLEEARRQQELWRLYCQGQEHFDGEKWQQAIDSFEQLVALDENYRDARAKLEETRLQIELEALYVEALQRQEAKEWAEAADLYVQIQAKRRGYKDTTQRLAEVDKQAKLLDLYRQACEFLANKDWPAATARLHEIQALDAGYQDVAQLLQDAENQERLLVLYCQAEDYLVKGNWSMAVEALEGVLAIDKAYGQAAELLKEASYNQGMHCQQEGRLEEAIQCFERAGTYKYAEKKLAEVKRHRECLDLLEAINRHCDRKEWVKAQEAISRVRQLDGCEALVDKEGEKLALAEAYSRGMWHFDRGEWWQSIVEFHRIKNKDSNYREVASVLKKALDRNLLRRNYTIQEAIASTPTTRVYKAQDHQGDTVAIKMLTPSYVDSQEPWYHIEAMWRGAESTQQLRHPHIVSVRGYEVRGWEEAGTHNDVHIVVMDYVEGKDLATVLNQRKKLRVGEVIHVAEQVCEALVHAHSKDVLHGDLKPSNILMSRDGQVKVTDFANAPQGTLPFRAPEQVRGREMGPYTDVYSLGQVICKLVTGMAPYRAGNNAWLLPKDIARLVEKATRPEPAQRYQSAQEMLAAIRKAKRSLRRCMFAEWLRRQRDGVWQRYRVPAILLFLFSTLLTLLAAGQDSPMGQWFTTLLRPAPTVTLAPTATPTLEPTSFSYPTPALLSPGEGTSFARGQNVKLVWEWEGDLGENEFFEVRIRLKGQQEFDLLAPTTLLYQYVPASGLPQSGSYEWQVAIVSRLGEEKSVSRIGSFEVQ